MSLASYQENGQGYMLETDAMTWFWDHYVPNQSQRDEPYACPAKASDLSNLPPALIVTAEFDPLRDEGELYAAALNDAGTPATAKRYDGLIHDFFSTAAIFPCSRTGLIDTVEQLKEHLN